VACNSEIRSLWTLQTPCVVAGQPYDVRAEGSPVNRRAFLQIFQSMHRYRWLRKVTFIFQFPVAHHGLSINHRFLSLSQVAIIQKTSPCRVTLQLTNSRVESLRK